jgi:predicted methyltransferase
MVGLAMIAPPTRSRFLIAATIAAAACLGFLAFAAPRPGMKVLDMGAGGGYSSELMARAVAPSGIVFAQIQPISASAPRPRFKRGWQRRR